MMGAMARSVRAWVVVSLLSFGCTGKIVGPDQSVDDGFHLAIRGGALRINVGEIVQLEVIATDRVGQPYRGSYVVDWSSTNASVAAIDSSGRLIALAAGTSVLTASGTRVHDGATATATIVVIVGH